MLTRDLGNDNNQHDRELDLVMTIDKATRRNPWLENGLRIGH